MPIRLNGSYSCQSRIEGHALSAGQHAVESYERVHTPIVYFFQQLEAYASLPFFHYPKKEHYDFSRESKQISRENPFFIKY